MQGFVFLQRGGGATFTKIQKINLALKKEQENIYFLK